MNKKGVHINIKPLTFPDIHKMRKSDEDFMEDLVEVANDLRKTLLMLTSIIPDKTIVSTHFAVLLGLMVRIYKLYDSFIFLICEKRMEIALLLVRSLCDSAIDVTYLCENMSDEEFQKFIKSSLVTGKIILEEIEKDKSNGVGDPNMQKRIKESILSDFSISNITPEEVSHSDKNLFGNTYNRAKKCGLEKTYNFIFRNLSRSIHGNWSELLHSHLKNENDIWMPSHEYKYPKPAIIDGSSVMVVRASQKFVKIITHNSEMYDRLNQFHDWFMEMANENERFHRKIGE